MLTTDELFLKFYEMNFGQIEFMERNTEKYMEIVINIEFISKYWKWGHQ